MLRQAITGGRKIVIKPAQPGAPRRFDPELIAERIVIAEPDARPSGSVLGSGDASHPAA